MTWICLGPLVVLMTPASLQVLKVMIRFGFVLMLQWLEHVQVDPPTRDSGLGSCTFLAHIFLLCLGLCTVEPWSWLQWHKCDYPNEFSCSCPHCLFISVFQKFMCFWIFHFSPRSMTAALTSSSNESACKDGSMSYRNHDMNPPNNFLFC